MLSRFDHGHPSCLLIQEFQTEKTHCRKAWYVTHRRGGDPSFAIRTDEMDLSQK